MLNTKHTLFIRNNNALLSHRYNLFFFLANLLLFSWMQFQTGSVKAFRYLMAELILAGLYTCYIFFKKYKLKQGWSTEGFLWLLSFTVPLTNYLLLLIPITLSLIISMEMRIRKEQYIFEDERIIYRKPFYRKIYTWPELEYVVLKDDILSIGWQNNRVIQQEILPGTITAEQAFNDFCKNKLANRVEKSGNGI